MSPALVPRNLGPSGSTPTPTLVVLAAGLSTRYGGVKPLAQVGPGGEALIDYALFDAARSGFGGAVVVVREEIESDVARHVGELTSRSWPVRFVCQRLDDIPVGEPPVAGRTKPWGTGHAAWTVRDVVHGPFAVVNADDFYGRTALDVLARGMVGPDPAECLAVTYRLADTLSTTAQVSRAILQVDPRGTVREIREVLRVHRTPAGIVGETPDGTSLTFTGDEAASMGLWGLQPSIFPFLESSFRTLLSHSSTDAPTEFYLSDTLNGLIACGDLRMGAVPSGVPSFGVTFPDDQAQVRARIETLVAEGRYPADLRSAFPALVNQNGFFETEP